MADATTVAIVSVLATGAVGLAAPIGAYFMQKQRFQKEREDKDLEELRQLLDASARVVAEALEAAGNVSGDIGDRIIDSPEGEQHLDSLRHCIVAVMNSAQRIAIRLGREDAAVDSYWRFWGKLAKLLDLADKPAEEVSDQELADLRTAIKHERNVFLKKAATVAGIESARG